MSNTMMFGDLLGFSSTTLLAEPTAPAEPAQPEPPVGYRWVSKRWRVLPDGTRDYAAYHGKTAFRDLLPVSSRLHSPKR